MASSLTVLGSVMAGNPINAICTADSPAGTITFHQLKFKVTSRRQNGTDKDYYFTKPVNNNDQASVDISTAVAAAYSDYEYTAEPPVSYPYIIYSVAVRDEYVLNGESHETGWTESGNLFALMGAFSDYERMTAGGETKVPTRLSRKPVTSPEVVGVGETHIRPYDFQGEGAGQTISTSVIVSEGEQTVNSVQVYAVPSSPDRHEVRLINGLGGMESLSICTREKVDVNINVENKVIARHETFGRFSRGITKKQNDYEKWQFTSGPLDKAWAAWYIHEFLMSEVAWLRVGNVWIPCSVEPEETTTLIDRTKADAIEVLFTLKLDINGSPLSAIAV